MGFRPQGRTHRLQELAHVPLPLPCAGRGRCCSDLFASFFSPTESAKHHAGRGCTEAPRKIFHAKLTIPATAGTLTLYYPKWIPGEHAPDGPIVDLAGLKFTANGQPL